MGLRGGPGRFEGCMRVSGFHKVLTFHSSTKLCKDSTRVPQGSTMPHQGCVTRPSFEKPSDQDRFAHGRNTKQNVNFSTLSLFCDLLTCSGKCWLCGKSDHVAAELTVQQSKCLALLLGGLWVPRISRGCEGYEVRRFPSNSAKATGQP